MESLDQKGSDGLPGRLAGGQTEDPASLAHEVLGSERTKLQKRPHGRNLIESAGNPAGIHAAIKGYYGSSRLLSQAPSLQIQRGRCASEQSPCGCGCVRAG